MRALKFQCVTCYDVLTRPVVRAAHVHADASSWAEGLRPAVQAEWLCDCYRLRVHDDAHYGAGYLHGPSHPAATPTSVLQDFFVFCKLAVANRLVPRDWQWGVFLQHASEALPYA